MKKFAFITLFFLLGYFTLQAQDSLSQYTGKFKFPEGSVVTEVTVVLENGVLTLTSAMGNASIEKTGEDAFSIPSYGGTASFKRNDAKKITGIKIEVMNIVLEGTREESSIRQSMPPAPMPVPMLPKDPY